MTQTNPLQRYFRQPAIYIRLPSNGDYYRNDSLEMTPNGEFPVYPMTAMDEITYRTADALFNGNAVASVIESCVPNIKNAWEVPSIDLDTLLISIRIASYGHEMDFETTCPSCENENSYSLDLRTVLDAMKSPDYSKSVQLGDMEIFFQPMTYQEQNNNSMVQFEDQKLLETVPDADIPETEKIKLLNSAFVKLGEMTLNAIAQSISMIKVGDEVVTEPEYIQDFIKNCDRSIFNRIRDRITELKQETELQPVKVSCQNCGHQYETPFTLDVSNFFGSSS